MGPGLADVIDFLRLGRPHFLFPGLILFACGALLAVPPGSRLDSGRFCIGYAVVLTAHVSLNYGNEYFDFESDARSTPGPVSGGSGVLRKRPDLRPLAGSFSLTLAALSVVIAVLFMLLYSLQPVYLGLVLFGNLLCWFYAAPPLRLSCRGMGEIASIVGIGFLVAGAGSMSMTGAFPPSFLAFVMPLLCYAFLFILSVELPDMEADVAGKKRTFVVRFGRGAGYLLIGLLALVATVSILFAQPWETNNMAPVALFSLLPLAPALAGALLRPSGYDRSNLFAFANVTTLTIFIMLADAYFMLPLV
jgi:1,4-dihydroxy-2-naphthoate octaprenyltransferase